MPWKTDDNGTMVLTDGNPVWIEEDGTEKTVNYSAMADSLRKANREAAERKAALRELEPLKAAVEGIEDLPGFVKTAKKNAELVAAMDAKAKQGEEDMQARIAAALKPVQDKLAESENARAELTSRYNAEKIGNAFAGSKYAAEKLQSAALARELFARNFTVEDGELVARSATGEPLYNGEGKPANFDEALAQLVAASPYQSMLVKGSTANGSGANPGTSNVHGYKTMSRGDFDKLNPAEKMKAVKDGVSITD